MEIASTAALRLDPILALVAGERAWVDGSDVPSTRDRGAALVQLIGLSAALTMPVGRLASMSEQAARPVALWAAGTLSVVGALALAVPAVRVLVGRARRGEGLGLAVARRGAAGTSLVAGLATLSPAWHQLALWPLGLALAGDAVRTSWLLGSMRPPSQWWRRFVVSPVHLGIVGALLALAVRGYRAGGFLAQVLPTYLAIHLTVAVGVVVATALERLRSADDRERAVADAHGERRAHRMMAEWLHDEVSAEVRSVRLQLATTAPTLDEFQRMIDDLDHALRVRQLEETFRSGRVRPNEIVQAYIRRAQNRGIVITESPARHPRPVDLPPDVGHQVRRAISVLTANALNAGATSLGFAVRYEPGAVVIEVRDDAGGFDWDDVPDGRALSALREELGHHALTIRRVPGGSLVSASVRTAAQEQDHGPHADRR